MSEAERSQTGGRRDGAPTIEPRRTGERLVAILFAGLLLLNFPLLSLLRGLGLVAGVPALYLYLFLVWTLVAGATALVLHRRPPAPTSAADAPKPGEP